MNRSATVVLGSAIWGLVAACGSGQSDVAVVTITNDSHSVVTIADCADARCSGLASDVIDEVAPGAKLEHNVDADSSAVTWVRVSDNAGIRCLDLSAASLVVATSAAHTC